MLGDTETAPLPSNDETKPMLGKSPSVDGFFIGDHPDSHSEATSISDDYLNAKDSTLRFHDPLTRVRHIFNIRKNIQNSECGIKNTVF